MSPYFAHLNLPFEHNLRPLATFKTDVRQLGHVLRDPNRLDPRLVKLLAERDIKVSHAEAFYTPPHRVLPIHVDHDKFTNLVKMNFCYGAKGSKMHWWKPISETYEPVVRLTSVGTKYIYVDIKDVELVETAEIGCPTLVNVGQPHSILNDTASMRWVLSCVLWCTKDRRDLTLDEARDRLRDFLA